jgi:hypothetical protein
VEDYEDLVCNRETPTTNAYVHIENPFVQKRRLNNYTELPLYPP